MLISPLYSLHHEQFFLFETILIPSFLIQTLKSLISFTKRGNGSRTEWSKKQKNYCCHMNMLFGYTFLQQDFYALFFFVVSALL